METRWTIIGQVGRTHDKVLCRCECGTLREVVYKSITRGISKSCGCLNRELCRQRATKHGLPRKKLYMIWSTMKARCTNIHSVDYPRYGGRGIYVCTEWHDYAPFFHWAMASGYSEGLSIERKNNDGNYQPSNCIWIPLAQQGWNKQNTRLITAFGETKHVGAWVRDPRCVLKSFAGVTKRLDRGISPEQALTMPIARPRRITTIGSSTRRKPVKL